MMIKCSKTIKLNKNYRIVIALLAAIGLPLALALFLFLEKSNPVTRESLNETVTALLLWWAGVAATWAAKETFDQKVIANKTIEEIRKQNDYEMRPYLRLQWSSSNDYILEVVNDGRGLALDVKFESVTFDDDGFLTPIQIKSRPLIRPGGNTNVSREELRESCGSTLLNDRDVKIFLSLKIKCGYRIRFNYTDLVGNKYTGSFVSDDGYNDKFRIEHQDKVN